MENHHTRVPVLCWTLPVWSWAWSSAHPSSQRGASPFPATTRATYSDSCRRRAKSPISSCTSGSTGAESSLPGRQLMSTRSRATTTTAFGQLLKCRCLAPLLYIIHVFIWLGQYKSINGSGQSICSNIMFEVPLLFMVFVDWKMFDMALINIRSGKPFYTACVCTRHKWVSRPRKSAFTFSPAGTWMPWTLASSLSNSKERCCAVQETWNMSCWTLTTGQATVRYFFLTYLCNFEIIKNSVKMWPSWNDMQ